MSGVIPATIGPMRLIPRRRWALCEPGDRHCSFRVIRWYWWRRHAEYDMAYHHHRSGWRLHIHTRAEVESGV